MNTGGPAFPSKEEKEEIEEIGGTYIEHHLGMTLRDYIAAKALQGLLSNPTRVGGEHDFCDASYCWADAMLKAREQ